MSWPYEFTRDADKDLRELPRDVQERVERALDQTSNDPFQGSVKPLKGREWKGVYRRRLGSYRILYGRRQKANHIGCSNRPAIREDLPVAQIRSPRC